MTGLSVEQTRSYNLTCILLSSFIFANLWRSIFAGLGFAWINFYGQGNFSYFAWTYFWGHRISVIFFSYFEKRKLFSKIIANCNKSLNLTINNVYTYRRVQNYSLACLDIKMHHSLLKSSHVKYCSLTLLSSSRPPSSIKPESCPD